MDMYIHVQDKVQFLCVVDSTQEDSSLQEVEQVFMSREDSDSSSSSSSFSKTKKKQEKEIIRMQGKACACQEG